MLKLKRDDSRTGGKYHIDDSETESIGTDRPSGNGPLNRKSGKKSARFNIPDSTMPAMEKDTDPYVEITLDIRDDTVGVHSVKPVAGIEIEDPELTLLAHKLEKKPSSLGSSLIRSASSRIRQMSQEVKKLASMTTRAGPGRVDRSKSAAAHALKGLKFISKTDGTTGWPEVEKRFNELAEDGGLSRALFGQCIGMKESKEFAGELFDALARRRNISGNSITIEDLRDFWDQIGDQSFDSRLQTFFDMVDKNADGRLTEEEVKEIISLSASANKLSKIQEQAEEYACLIMEELDPNNLGYIELHNLETLLLQGPSHSVQFGTATTAMTGNTRNLMSRMLSQNLKPTVEPNPFYRFYNRAKYFLQDNWKRVWVMTLWLTICGGLFAWKFVQYRNRAVYRVMGYCVCTAKGAAETLKFNMALILFPVCRNTITWLRNKSKLGAAVPFDDNINFHKIIAIGIAAGVGTHAISHLACDFPRMLHAGDKEYTPMKPFFGEERPVNYWWFIKGTEGWTGIFMVVLMTLAFSLAMPGLRHGRVSFPGPLKRLTGYNAFWYSHHLFVIVYVLLLVHGTVLYLTKKWYKKTTWMYVVAPMILYASERLIRYFRSSIRAVKIVKVAVYHGNVLALHVSKPPGFRYRSGQYIFVNCAAVSPFEWHPFSITSAPPDDYVSVHIRTLGDWTRQLKVVFSEIYQRSAEDQNSLLGDVDSRSSSRRSSFPKVLIDGPYGAPAQDYEKYDVVLLVGLGIGATPFISVLKDIVNNMKMMEDMASSDDAEAGHDRSLGFKTRRAYFYWVTREPGSFEWFSGVMNEVAEMDQKGVIELHNYCTSVYEEGDARSALIVMLQSLHLAKNGVDVVSGTRVKTHFGRPKWREEFKRITLNHRDQRIGVFYCGAATLTKELRQLSRDFSHKTKTKFDFHKENF